MRLRIFNVPRVHVLKGTGWHCVSPVLNFAEQLTILSAETPICYTNYQNISDNLVSIHV
jgi:hypothetical protein